MTNARGRRRGSSLAMHWTLGSLLLRRMFLPAISAIFLAGCGGNATLPRVVSSPTDTPPSLSTSVPTPTLAAPTYVPTVLAQGAGCPDDVWLDGQGNLLFSDWYNGSVNQIASNGQVTSIARGLPKPEGIVQLPDGTLVVAEQGVNGEHINQLAERAPGTDTFTVFVRFPNTTGLPGVDGLSYDAASGSLLVADSANGTILRVALNGATTTIARGFVRPTMALADSTGHIYVADEYGNAVARIDPDGSHHILLPVADPDDLAFDRDGSLLVTALGNNTLIRIDPQTGTQLAIVAQNLFEPQGLAVDSHGTIYVAEERANSIIALRRGGTTAPFTPPAATTNACG